jgi:hypothetical protein
MKRVSALAFAALVMVVSAAPPVRGIGFAQSQQEVDAARAEAEAARVALDVAASELLAAEISEGLINTELLTTIAAFEQAAADLRSTGHAALAVRSEIDALETSVGDLRDDAADAAVAAYRRGIGGRSAVWSTDSFHHAVMLGSALEEPIRRAVSSAEDLESERGALAQKRDELATEEAKLRDRRDGLDRAEAQLADALGIARDILRAATNEVAQADDVYRMALEQVDLEQRRLAAVQGVEHWRPLVALYFPADRVGEAMQVMHCESRGNPDATNPTSDAAGLFQFLETTWAFASVKAGFTGASRYDPEANVAAAAWLVHYSIVTDHPRGAWGHWSCQPAASAAPGRADVPGVEASG